MEAYTETTEFKMKPTTCLKVHDCHSVTKTASAEFFNVNRSVRTDMCVHIAQNILQSKRGNCLH